MKTKQAAKKLQSMGTGGDTILAHINAEEAMALKAGGGSGKRNPKTGLLSFSLDGPPGGGDVAEGSYGGFGGVDGGLGAALAEALGIPSDPSSGLGGASLLGGTGYGPGYNADLALAAFDRSQPNQGLQNIATGALGKMGLPGMALSGLAAMDRARAERNSGAGYGIDVNGNQVGNWGGGGMMGGEARESGMGGDMAGNPAGQQAAAGLLGTMQTHQINPWQRPQLDPKFGRLRETLSTFTDPYAKVRRGGLLGG